MASTPPRRTSDGKSLTIERPSRPRSPPYHAQPVYSGHFNPAQTDAIDYFSMPSANETKVINSIADELEVQDDGFQYAEEPKPYEDAEEPTPSDCDHPKPSSSINLHVMPDNLELYKNASADPSERRGLLDMRILDGKRVNKAGKILDYEGRIMGELCSGQLEKCAGAYVDEKGHVYDKHGKHVGYARIVSGEGAGVALKELMEGLEIREKDEESTGDKPS